MINIKTSFKLLHSAWKGYIFINEKQVFKTKYFKTSYEAYVACIKQINLKNYTILDYSNY